MANVVNRFIVVLNTHLRHRLVVPGVIAITEPNVSDVVLGKLERVRL